MRHRLTVTPPYAVVLTTEGQSWHLVWHDEYMESVGQRLRQKRKLQGLTQTQLANGAAFSESLVKKVEQGSAPPSPAFVSGVARVLNVSTSYLYGVDHHEIADAPEIDVVDVAALRMALDSYDDPQPEGKPLTLEQVERRIDRAGSALMRMEYRDVGKQLPGLLHHIYPLAQDSERGRAVLHDAYRMAATVAGRLRANDVAAVASERHQRLAQDTGDPLRVCISAFSRSTPHLQRGTYSAGLRVIDKARGYLDDSPNGHAMAIQLHLRSAILAARDAQQELADDYLADARAISDQYRPPAVPYYNVMTGRTNIDVHWCAVPMENYDGAESVRRSQRVEVDDASQPERVGHHYIDMARAWLLYGDRDQVLSNLNQARRWAPFNTRHHPAVRETILSLAENDRRRSDSLSGFARWAGIEVA